MATNLTVRTKPSSTNMTARTKPEIYSLWTSSVLPWQLSLPWQHTGTIGGTDMTPRVKP